MSSRWPDTAEWLEADGLGDADAPHTPRGCPFQAWSLGELMSVERALGSGNVRSSPYAEAM